MKWISFIAWPGTLDGGGKVWFTVKVRNYRPDKLDVRGFIENEDGAVIVKMGDGVVYSVPDGGEESFTFSHTLYSVSNHTFGLFFDPDDGTPNGEGEEHWKEVTVEVKPVGNVISSMNCTPAVVPLDGSTTCTVGFKLRSADTVTLNLKEVDFGGKKVWPNGPSSIIVSERTITISPTNVLSITIDTDKEFTDYYLKHPPIDYGYKMIGYSYLVVAKIGDELRVSDVIQLGDPVDVQTPEDKARKVYNIIKTIGDIFDDVKSGAFVIVETVVSKGGKEALWIWKYHTLLEDVDGNTNIIS